MLERCKSFYTTFKSLRESFNCYQLVKCHFQEIGTKYPCNNQNRKSFQVAKKKKKKTTRSIYDLVSKMNEQILKDSKVQLRIFVQSRLF